MGTGDKEPKGAKPLDVNEPPQRVRLAARNGSIVGGVIGGIIGGLIGALICCYCQHR
jgi:hypothetical protein